MAKKFIDAEMLISELDASCMPIFEKGISGILGDEQSIADVIREQPSADVQEVVRCKECKYLKYDRDFTTGRYCSLRNANGGKYCKDDDYCSYGKRKEGDKNNG